MRGSLARLQGLLFSGNPLSVDVVLIVGRRAELDDRGTAPWRWESRFCRTVRAGISVSRARWVRVQYVQAGQPAYQPDERGCHVTCKGEE